MCSRVAVLAYLLIGTVNCTCISTRVFYCHPSIFMPATHAHGYDRSIRVETRRPCSNSSSSSTAFCMSVSCHSICSFYSHAHCQAMCRDCRSAVPTSAFCTAVDMDSSRRMCDCCISCSPCSSSSYTKSLSCVDAGNSNNAWIPNREHALPSAVLPAEQSGDRGRLAALARPATRPFQRGCATSRA